MREKERETETKTKEGEGGRGEGVITSQCCGSRRGEEERSRERASETPQRMMDLASVWANTREKVRDSQEKWRRLRPRRQRWNNVRSCCVGYASPAECWA